MGVEYNIFGGVFIDKSQLFVKKVLELAKEMELNVFVVTDGASGITNKDNLAVKHAREEHIKWEQINGCNPYSDWDKD